LWNGMAQILLVVPRLRLWWDVSTEARRHQQKFRHKNFVSRWQQPQWIKWYSKAARKKRGYNPMQSVPPLVPSCAGDPLRPRSLKRGCTAATA
jgi:hypothetical protein